MRKNLLCLIATVSLATCASYASAAAPETKAHTSDALPTAVSGESWLNHLHRSFGDTSMGKTGRLGPPASEENEQPVALQLGSLMGSGQTVTLRGADLYRLNCQACHGEAGLGAPPEINSVINPVRATSVPLVIDRMKKTGMDISSGEARELAIQANDALLQRIHNGGRDMPAFPHLSAPEIRALVGYLNVLAGVKPAQAEDTVVEESRARVGEHIVKSTCHICHDATGLNPTPQQMEDGAIPPLEALTTRTDQVELVQKVTRGAPVIMGTPPSPHRGRMPVFYYLTQDEAADVYLYLSAYPPMQVASNTPTIAGTQQNSSGSGSQPEPPMPSVSTAASYPISIPAPPGGIPDWVITLSLIALGSGLIGLAALGLGFAAYELCRLGREGEYRDAHPSATARKHVGELVAR
jgi:mono/diheme cytochrome c family protein